jgi:glutamyl-tRNA reductase
MAINIIGINHRTAPVAIRERVAFGPENLRPALTALQQLDGVQESLIVSTCNRTELYCQLNGTEPSVVESWLLEQRGVDPSLAECIYKLGADEAVHHTFAVASGLDSAILGEPQILGQMKDAYRLAHAAGTTGPVLNSLFQHAFSVAKHVRTDTDIGTSAVSVAYAAVSLARQIFAGFERHSALLVGAGQTIELVAQHLYGHGMKRLIIANRSITRARDLATPLSGFAISLEEVATHLPESDIVISSTASPVPIITRDAVASALKSRRRRPMFIVDIAVPRDVEPEVAELEDVYLYTVDDLQSVIEQNLKSRQAAAEEAQEIIGAEVARFQLRQRGLSAVPTIRDLRAHARSVRDRELRQAHRALASGRAPQDVLEVLSHNLVNKLMHSPSIMLREAAEAGDRELLRVARLLFNLRHSNDEAPDDDEPDSS